MLELKPGVRLDNMSPQIGLAVQVAVRAWSDCWFSKTSTTAELRNDIPIVRIPFLVITSINDGKHSRTSLHHIGHACDLRTKTLPSATAKRWFAAEVRRRLGAEYDVILEGLGTANEHLHVEYQPKR